MAESIAVFVPSPAFGRHDIKPGSGIVGTLDESRERVLVDYEGNLYGASNIVTFADRVLHAWGRHEAKYPTIARLLLPPEAMLAVGWFVPSTGIVVVADAARELLEEWLGVSPIPPAELAVTSWR